jgi:hypothetical protein
VLRKLGGNEIKWVTSAAVYADDVNILADNIDTTNKNTENVNDASKVVELKENAEETKYMLLSHH